MVWYSSLFKNFPQFVVIYIVKVFSIVSEAEVHVLLNSLAFSMIQWMLVILSLLPLFSSVQSISVTQSCPTL